MRVVTGGERGAYKEITLCIAQAISYKRLRKAAMEAMLGAVDDEEVVISNVLGRNLTNVLRQAGNQSGG